jgi:hypothetical protein
MQDHEGRWGAAIRGGPAQRRWCGDPHRWSSATVVVLGLPGPPTPVASAGVPRADAVRATSDRKRTDRRNYREIRLCGEENL